MKKPQDILNEILACEKQRIRASYTSSDVVFPLVEIIRTLDYHSLVLKAKLDSPDQALLFDKYLFGWALAFQVFYENLRLDDNIPLFSFEKKDREWVDQIVQHAGSLQITSQYLDYCKAELVRLESHDNENFFFHYLHMDFGSEYYERLSTDHYFSVVSKVLEEKNDYLVQNLPAIRRELTDIVEVWHEKFISYKATEQLDIFYKQLGYMSLMTNQVVDDFDEDDAFGGIPYRKYIDQVEYGYRAALMHRDCCMELAAKTSYAIDLRDILSYGFSLTAFIDSLASYTKEKPEVLREVVSCLSINKDNFQFHLAYPGVSAPLYFQLGNDTSMRSVCGCLDKPVLFLNRELKRKYPTEFFNAVNRRESRFRKELYDLFPDDQIIKVHQNTIIRTQNGDTDIDAILFDTSRNVLGLFQLKWHDSFSTSMKERFSRITNLIPKAEEWIEKVTTWLKSTDSNSILKNLRINDNTRQHIDDVYLFVIARHHVHFTNQQLDERAIWASWFQLLEAHAKVKGQNKQNPIGELAAKLNFFSPELRRKREQPRRPLEFELNFSKYKIIVQNTSDPLHDYQSLGSNISN